MPDQEPIETDEQQQADINEEAQPQDQGQQVEEEKPQPVDDEIVQLTKSFSTQQIKNALQLAADLADPEKAAEVVEDLVARVKPKVTPKVSAPVATNEILTRMKSKVPQEYGLIIDALAPAILEAIDSKSQVTVDQVRELSQTVQQTRFESEYNVAVSDLRKEFKDFDKHLNAITALTAEMQIGPGVPIKKHLKNLYIIATNGASASQVVETINRNAQKGIRSPSTGASNGTVRNGSVLPSLEEAFAAGARGERFS